VALRGAELYHRLKAIAAAAVVHKQASKQATLFAKIMKKYNYTVES